MPALSTVTARSSRAARVVSRTVFGIAAIAVAVAIRIPLEPTLQGRNDFILLEPAIAVAAWYGGFVSGTTATFTAVIASTILYLGRPDPGAAPPGEVLSMALFALNGLLLTTLSAGLRRAYERATDDRLRAETSAARSDQLQRIALALNRPMSPQVLAQTAIEQAVVLLGASGGLVAIGRATDDELRILATHGYTGDTAPGRVANGASGPLGEAIRGGEPIIFHSRAERQARYPAAASQFKIDGDSIVLPLLYQGLAVGALYLNFEGASGYRDDDREFLRSIGVQFGSALQRAALTERADAMAVSDQTRAAELRTVLEAIGDGLLVGGADGRTILSNPAAELLLGRVPGSLADLPEPAGDGRLHGQASIERFLARSPVRARGWLEIARFPVAAGGPSSEVALIRDVTATVEAEMQRDAFLGVLSHELRTPITTILAGVAVLRRAKPHAYVQSRKLLADIDAESSRLHRIVEDLLVLTRSERGALDVRGEPVLVHRIVKDVIERARLDARDVEIRLLAADNLAPVEAEPTYVQQIVRNFLSNALKYGRAPGQPIEVVVSQAGDRIETRVLDRGVGFSPGDDAKLFTLFYRNPRAVASAPGAGIGLYVCRLLAEAMGGEAWANARPGGGAEVGFALPLVSEHEPAAAEPDGEVVEPVATSRDETATGSVAGT